MKTLTRLSLTASTCALALCASSLDASATPTWKTIPGSPKGHAAVAVGTNLSAIVYFLNSTWLPIGGWQLQGYDFERPSQGVFNIDQATTSGPYHFQGTSLAIDQGTHLWLILANNTVQSVDLNFSAPGTACEGGTTYFRQEGGHNNLAVQNTSQGPFPPSRGIFVIDGNGRVRTWVEDESPRACWALEPTLPSGAVVNDISVKPNGGNLWAADANGAVFVLTPGGSVVSNGQISISGASWQSLDGSNGRVKFLGGKYATNTALANRQDVAVGFDNMSVYNWDDVTGWHFDPDWNHWQFLLFGTSLLITTPSPHFIDEVAVGLENTIWAKVNQ